MGREGLQKVCKYFANLQQKRTKESSKDENNKGGDKNNAAKNKDGTAKNNYSSNKKNKNENQEHAQKMEKLREALVSNARWISSQHFLDHCRSAVNLGKGEIASFVERWVYGCG